MVLHRPVELAGVNQDLNETRLGKTQLARVARRSNQASHSKNNVNENTNDIAKFAKGLSRAKSTIHAAMLAITKKCPQGRSLSRVRPPKRTIKKRTNQIAGTTSRNRSL